ncbi:MAG: tetratricopeptide repeat protein [Rhodospirillales bacterium]
MADANVSGTENQKYDELIQRGVAQLGINDLEGMADSCAIAAREVPDRPEAYALLGVLSFVMDDFGRSIELLTKAHEIDPDMRECAEFLAHVHARAGNLNDSVYFAKIAGTGDSSPLLAGVEVEGLNDLAAALDESEEKSYLMIAQKALSENRYADAVAECEKELRLRAGDLDVFLTLGAGLIGLDKPQRAMNAFRAAIHIDPTNPDAHLGLAQVLISLGEPGRAAICVDKAANLGISEPGLLAKAASVSAMINPKTLPESIAAAWPAQTAISTNRKSDSDAGDLRIGYLTDCARNANEMRILESMLSGQDRESVISIVYSANVPGDPTPSRLGSLSAGWLNIRDHGDEAVITRMRADKLDLLFDLTFRPGGERPGILQARPTPLIIGNFGPKPGFLGASYDRFLVHRLSATGDKRELPIDVSPLAIDPKTMAPVGDTVPAKERGYVTFGTTLDLSFLTPAVAATYAEVLRAVPGSRLMLGNRNLVPEEVRNRAMDYFADHGVIDRIDIEEFEFRSDETIVVRRLKFMVSIDVYLETFPTGGPLSTIDALWAGTTVVAMNGRPIDGAVAPSILHAANLSEWVAADRDGYIEAAVAAAGRCEDHGFRAAFRDKVRETSVFDVKTASRGLEKALRHLLDR